MRAANPLHDQLTVNAVRSQERAVTSGSCSGLADSRNPYEELGAERKATALLEYLDAESMRAFGELTSSVLLRAFTRENWIAIANEAKVNEPHTSIALMIERAERREARRAA